MDVKIDISSIPEELLLTEDFKVNYKRMHDRYSEPGFIEALCAHEAAHAYYYELIGPIRYELLKPSLTYKVSRGRYEGYLAALNITEYPEFRGTTKEALEEYLLKMAQANAAGPVVGRKFLRSGDVGIEGDKLHFEEFCTGLVAYYRGIRIDVDRVWRDAIEAVEAQLDADPQILQNIQQRSIALRKEFGVFD